MSPYSPKAAPGRLRSLAFLVVALAALSSLLVAASGGEARTGKATAVNPHLLLGITGNPARFKTQTGQDSAVQQVFLGWGQGVTYGSPLAQFLPTLAPIPMLHLSTKNGQTGAEAISPGEIASGAGDSYLVGLNKAIAVFGKAIYVRPMAEMNNAGSVYGAYNANGTARDANHSTASFRKAFARIYVILHGGTASAINAKLKQLGMPSLRATGDLLDNPFPTLRVVWSPLASDIPRVAGNAAEQYYPGKSYVDVEGGDIYDEALTDTAPWAGLERLYTAAVGRGEPFSVPEWGLKDVDDPAFVRHMCTFLQTHGATETAVFYEFPSGSPYDLDPKPSSRAAYRQCLTPLAGDYPSWALGNEPGGGAKLIALSLTPKPASGTPPQAVVFTVHAKLTQPIAHWEIIFGDGATTEGDGPPPSTIPHAYKRTGIYHAVLFVFRAPPFTIEDTPFFTAADVIVGTGPNELLSLVPTPDSGPPPLSVSFRVDEVPSGATGWKMIFGDGLTRDESGPPPHFSGHTFAKAGTYPVLLIVNTSSGSYAAVAQVVAGSGGGGRRWWWRWRHDHHDPERHARSACERDVEGRRARERQAVQGRTGSVRREGRRHRRLAPPQDGHGTDKAVRRGRRRLAVQAPARHRRGQADRGPRPHGRRLQQLSGAQDEQRCGRADQAGPTALGQRQGEVPDEGALRRRDRPRDDLGDHRSL